MLRSFRFCMALMLCLLLLAAGCNRQARSKFPGTNQGAEQVAREFIKKGANYAALTETLRPTKEDYTAIFKEEFAAKLESAYASTWSQPENLIAPRAGETEVKMFGATAMELERWSGYARDFFPEGWRTVGQQLKHRDLQFYPNTATCSFTRSDSSSRTPPRSRAPSTKA
jgi:hypothetical protein